MDPKPYKRGDSHAESETMPNESFVARMLLEMKVSAHAELRLEEHRLHVRADFGELTIPYDQIRKVTKGVPSSIAVEVAGAQIWLDVLKSSEFTELLSRLDQRTVKPRSSHQ